VSPEALITDANLLVAAMVAFAAGIVSFASPCVVPLVPGYLSYMTGLSAAELRGGAGGRLRVLAGSSLFVLGFAVPITLLGVLGALIGTLLSDPLWRSLLGALVIVLGAALAGLLPAGWLQAERRVTDRAFDGGVLSALPLGFVFGVGWTPCLGPTAGAILTLSAGVTAGVSLRGAFLGFVYALGLGLPFVLFGLLFRYLSGTLDFLKRNARRLQVAGGGLLVAVGLAIATVRSRPESRFSLLWIEGEISNLSRPSSAHLYFTLKDNAAQVRCAMFCSRNRLLRFNLKEGMQVLVRARVGLYEARGEFQLIVEHLEEAGDGALRQAFEELKQRLAAEGLFAAEHKQPLPILPRRIGIVTSPTGAAIQDILSVLKRRFPAIPAHKTLDSVLRKGNTCAARGVCAGSAALMKDAAMVRSGRC
jgi:cytochrome c-type biogenesis protein